MRLANLKSKLLACFALLTMLVGQVAAVDMQNCQMHMSPSVTLDKPAANHQTSEHQGHDHAMHAEHDMQMMEDTHQAADSSAHDCCKTAKAECQCPHQICHNAGIILTELAIDHVAATPNKITKSFESFISQPSASLYRPPITL
ncbi:hypothetical protein [Catenovulum agarivorans]|uniref:hypothetical protein n=1 Tax=Catenovulum agarivorans TaxID=1172192 RepID=UPI0002F283BA|nr:hypothetical protein [Catenovulum agarivorans]